MTEWKIIALDFEEISLYIKIDWFEYNELFR